MAYPKPLSRKTIERMYEQSGIPGEVQQYLHLLFKACANLYGHAELRDIWAIHSRLKGVPKVQRKQMVEFAGIARRDGDLPYCVFEADELWDDVRRSGVGREIVHKDLVGGVYRKLLLFYDLNDSYSDNYPFYIPEDLLSYAEPIVSEEEKALQEFIENLEVTSDTCVSRHGREYPCENQGRRLKDFSFMTDSEKYLIEYYKSRPVRQAELLQECSGSEAEKLLRKFKKMDTIGRVPVPMAYRYLLEELAEVGVQLTEDEIADLLGKFTAAHNSSHLWCLFGWTPIGLREAFGGSYYQNDYNADEVLDEHMNLADFPDSIEDEMDSDDFVDNEMPVEAEEKHETDLQRRMREHGLKLIE